MKRVTLLVFSLFICNFLSAQVVVNEFCIANYNDYNVGGQFEDWVEFYNPSGVPIDLSGYYLSDDIADNTKWSFPAGTQINASGYLVVLISGEGLYNPGYLGAINTNFKINQTAGENLVFSNALGVVLETYDFSVISPNQRNHSWGRTPDGSANWLIQTNPSQMASNNGVTGTGYAIKPSLDMNAGYYNAAITVNISTAEPGGVIYYTTNGTTPTNASTMYSGPINISTTTVLKAIVYSPTSGILPSYIETNTYFFGSDQHSVLTVSISGATLDGSWSGNELTDLEFFSPGGTFMSEAHGDSNEHGNDSNAYGQRGFDFIVRDELGYDNTVHEGLFQERDRTSFDRLIFKAAANDNYPFSNGGAHIRDAYVCELSILGGLHLDERATRSCIVYINGSYWGVYEVREKVDDLDFTDHYYSQPRGQVDFLKTWGGTWAEFSAAPTFNPQATWNSFVSFCTTNSLAIPANYNYVQSQFNTISLIDYFILNGYSVCTDWLNWNTAWWRGYNPLGDAKRWRYALWDNDATFGHYINYTGVPSTQPTADPCQIESMGNVGGQGHIPVLNACFDNPDFLADYVQRYAELSNEIFSCTRMIEVLDSMISVMDPEMTRHCQRWGGTYNGWQTNVQDLRNFILARCANENSNVDVIEGIEDCYDVTQHTLTVQISGPGSVLLEETTITNANSPYSGTYFEGNTVDLPIQITAIDTTSGLCNGFLQWVVVSGNAVILEPSNPVTSVTISGDAVIEAQFSTGSTGPIDVVTLVSPLNSATVILNGNGVSNFPNTTSWIPGDTMSFSVVENSGFVFDHWETNSTIILPDEYSTSMDIVPCISDTISAVLIPIYSIDPAVSGLGSFTINGINSTQGGFIFTADEVISISASLLGVCSQFLGWEIVNGTGIIADPTSLNTSITISSNVTLQAVFNTPPVGSVPVTVITNPLNGGIINVAGFNINVFPTVVNVVPGVPISISATENNWYAFVNWQTIHSNLSSTTNMINVTTTVCQADTFIANYNFTEHYYVGVDVFPSGAGSVTLDGNQIPTYPFVQDLEAGITHSLNTLPANQWFVFDHWETDEHLILPNTTSSNVSFDVSAEDTIVAVYNVIPHSELQVLVDPPYSGTVNDNLGNSTRYMLVQELANNTNMQLQVFPDEFYEFDYWEFVNATPFSPDAKSDIVDFSLTNPEIVIAHMKRQPYVCFIPNSFTPNDDNKNDCIGPIGNAVDIEKFSWTIFGRHGEVVFHTENFNDCWNGSMNGGEYYVHSDVYHYEMKVKSVFDPDAKIVTGTITLVR